MKITVAIVITIDPKNHYIGMSVTICNYHSTSRRKTFFIAKKFEKFIYIFKITGVNLKTTVVKLQYFPDHNIFNIMAFKCRDSPQNR